MSELATYAVTGSNSRGRKIAEKAPQGRSEFQRDRDRIIHSGAFRRLEYKTQVFVNHEGDLFRTRLTHSIEVAQIARSIARSLRLNEDLAEAISLAHDLGHTPFGHAGQDALNACMKTYGGFEHNLQSLRVVDLLEEKYADFPGLNLTFETREGILKHCSLTNAKQLGELGRRFIEHTQPSLEAQITNIADEIAYNNHDVDDGLRADLINVEQLMEIELFHEPYTEVSQRYPGLPARRLIHETVRRMIDGLITDLIEHSCTNIAAAALSSIEDVHALAKPLITFSADVDAKSRALAQFLRKQLYFHPRVQRATGKAARIVRELFGVYIDDSKQLPESHGSGKQLMWMNVADPERARRVADYIAGMTDRYALQEYQRVTGQAVAQASYMDSA